MSRRSPARKRKSSRTAYTIMAALIVAVLALGTLAGLLSDQGSGDDDQTTNDSIPRETPGAEIARLETSVAENPDDVDTLTILAEVLANSGRVSESVPYFEQAIDRQPDDARLRMAFGRALLRMGSAFDAELQLKRAVELAPDDATAAYYLAQVYEAMGDRRIDDARAWYQKAIDLSPGSVVAQQAQNRLDVLGPEPSPSPGT